jgi:predicted Rossmann fold nucleotide-binding protein DprA/Smf involved in DNA uptake
MQRSIREALKRESMTMDQLLAATGLSAEALMPELSLMEITGHIRKEAGNLFSIQC